MPAERSALLRGATPSGAAVWAAGGAGQIALAGNLVNDVQPRDVLEAAQGLLMRGGTCQLV